MKNKKVMWFLLAMVIGIWGGIIYQIANAVSAETNTTGASPVSIEPENKSIDQYSYKADFRDPFQFSKPAPPETAKTHTKPHIVWMPPPLRLTGIVSSGRQHTAMIDKPDGEVFFLHKGDTLMGVSILEINDTGVTYRYSGKKGVFTLPLH